MFKALVTAIILIGFTTTTGDAQTQTEIAAYKRASEVMRGGDWPAALSSAEPAGSVAQDIVEWHRLRAGNGSFDQVVDFLASHSDWPGLKLLRREAEESVPTRSRPDEVVAFFAPEPPQTGAGVRALIAAHLARGEETLAEAEAVRAWRTMILSDTDQTALLSLFANTLSRHHGDRLDMLLWRGSRSNAERMYPLVSPEWQALARARLALRADADGVDALIAAVPAAFADNAGLAFERMQWRARKGRNDDAIDLMFSASPENLGEAEMWAGWRRSLARRQMRDGNADIAYRLAAQHGLADGAHFADLEWLAGYVALTYLDDPKTALTHFLRFRGAVESPISLGRAGYWEGRAHEAAGDRESARQAYAFGAEYQTSFYGLLAAEKAGLPLDPALAGRQEYPDWQDTSFADTSVFAAVRLFIAAGQRNLAEQFLTHITETLPEEEIGALGDYVLANDEPHLAVMIGKQAASRGIVVPRSYYPLAALGIGDQPVPPELALSIARRESEFDPVVQSGAGARGLMQLMPATAKAVAQYLQVSYSVDRLITDPAYNARLGTAYLDELMETFGGNVVMTSAGYNAGPGRPMRWMSEMGDPRNGDVDIVDWIEHIPFDETRNYVMRVTESLPVYRARLTGSTGAVTLTADLVGRPGHARSARKGEYIRPRSRPNALID